MRIENFEQIVRGLEEMDSKLGRMWTYIVYGKEATSSQTKHLQLFQLAGEVRATTNMIKRLKQLSFRIIQAEKEEQLNETTSTSCGCHPVT